MPNPTLQPVSAFGSPGQAQAQGLAQGTGLSLEQRGQNIQTAGQQIQATADQARIALQQQEAQRLASMMPGQVQGQQLQNQMLQRQMAMPQFTPVSEEVVNVPRPASPTMSKDNTKIDQDGYKESIANGATPEEAAAQNTVSGTEAPLFDQYKVETKRNTMTGELVKIPQLLKSAEQIRQEQTMAEKLSMQGMYYGGRNQTTTDNAEIRANANAKPEMQSDGHLHNVTKAYDPNTGAVTQTVGGINALEDAKLDEVISKSGKNVASTEHIKGLSGQTNAVTQRAVYIKDMGMANALGLSVEDFRALRSDPKGGAIIQAEVAGNPRTPEDQAYIDKFRVDTAKKASQATETGAGATQPPSVQYKSASDVIAAAKSGSLDPTVAHGLLVNQFGYTP